MANSMHHDREQCDALIQLTAPWRPPLRLPTPPRCRGHFPWSLAAVLALGLALALPCAVLAKTFHCGAGAVACLAAAITAANANGQANTIRLQPGTYTLTAPIDSTNSLPSITSQLTITGHGPETTILERDPSAPNFRLLQVAAPGSLTVTQMTLRGGRPSGPGAAIVNFGGTLSLAHMVLVSNFADGGAIVNFGGRVTIAHSTLATNGGAHDSGGLENTAGGTVTITGTTFVHNGADGAGAIRNLGTMEVSASTFLENHGLGSGFGGAIFNAGTLDVVNTTFARNALSTIFLTDGTAIYNAGVLFLASCTLADHTGQDRFSGIRGSAVFSTPGATTLLHNTILARNTSEPGLQDCGGMVISLGHNLIGDPTGCTIALLPSDRTGDPRLGPFMDNGRPGHGHYPLLPTSLAVDAGDDAACPRTDQLGRPRVGPCDIGAVRFRAKDRHPHNQIEEPEDAPLDDALLAARPTVR